MKLDYQTQTKLFKVLSHPTRLAILDILRDGEECVCHMEAAFGLRQAHISQHLMVLREAGLVSDRRDGWNIFYQTVEPEIYNVIDSMNRLFGMTSPMDSLKPFAQAQNPNCPCPKCNPASEATNLEKNLVQTP